MRCVRQLPDGQWSAVVWDESTVEDWGGVELAEIHESLHESQLAAEEWCDRAERSWIDLGQAIGGWYALQAGALIAEPPATWIHWWQLFAEATDGRA